MLFQLFSIYFCSLIINANAALSFVPGCDCLNPTYIDQPDNIVECWSKSKFYRQVNENFDLQYEFLDRGTAIGCNYTNYRQTVDYFKTVTKDIATMYFRCIDRDCEPAVYEGLNNWNQFVMETFYPFIVCSYTYYSPECAQNIKHSVYFSAENLLTTLIKCSNLKRTSQRPDSRLLLKEIFYKKSFECNCVKINERPIPASEEQCYSTKYFSTVKLWLNNNFSRVKATLYNATIAIPGCNYTQFVQNVIGLEKATNKWITILQSASPTFEILNGFSMEFLQKAFETNTITRNYILSQPKKCYFTPRQIRQSLLTISHYVFQILYKCVLYKDPKNSYC